MQKKLSAWKIVNPFQKGLNVQEKLPVLKMVANLPGVSRLLKLAISAVKDYTHVVDLARGHVAAIQYLNEGNQYRVCINA